MHKRFQLFGFVGLIGIILLLLIYAAINVLIRKEFIRIEDAAVRQNTARAIDALGERLEHLDARISDWASWDDSYAFVRDKNSKFISSNLVRNALYNVGADYIIFFDTQGKLVKLASYDTIDVKTTTALLAHFDTQSRFLSRGDNDSHRGYLRMPKGPLLFAAKPILDSDGNGPYRGTIVFAHYLNQEDVSDVSALNHLSITYLDGTKSLPEDIRPLAGQLSASSATIIKLSESVAEGYQYINDAYGKPYLIAEVSQYRSSYIGAKRTIMYFMIIVAAVLIVGMGVIMYVMRIVADRDETIRLKDEFFSIASHEIRTPLTAIKGNAQLLAQMYGDNNGQGFLDITSDIKTSSDRLVRLVTNFLDAARLEQGKIKVTSEHITLRIVAQEVVDELQSVGADKGVMILNDIRDSSLRGYADKDHVKQVLYNLIGNALKFTDKGSVKITASRTSATEVTVYITDTGRGVPECARQALFQKFEQAAKDDAANGSGLGLYISKLLVEKMGGAVRVVATEEGGGTTISFSLPISALHDAAADHNQSKEKT